MRRQNISHQHTRGQARKMDKRSVNYTINNWRRRQELQRMMTTMMVGHLSHWNKRDGIREYMDGEKRRSSEYTADGKKIYEMVKDDNQNAKGNKCEKEKQEMAHEMTGLREGNRDESMKGETLRYEA